MKTAASHKLTRLAATLTPALMLAATCGYYRLSDERLKQEVRPVEGALAKLRQIS